MEDEYMSNTSDIDDSGLINKIKQTEEELSKIRKELDEKNKLCLSQKHKIDDLSIEVKDLKEKNNNQNNLIKFYEEKSKKEEDSEIETDPEKKDKIKQLEIKIMNLNEKIRELEESIIKKDNDFDVVKQELEEEKEINQHALEMINEKEEEIAELKKKIEGGGIKKRKSLQLDLSPEEIQILKEEFLNQQDEIDQYKETSEKKIKTYSEENRKLLDELNELKDKNSNMETEISRLKEMTDTLEKEKRANEELIEKKKENDNIKVDDYLNEIHNLQKQLDETQRKNQEINEKQKEKNKNERKEYEKIINELKEKITTLEQEIKFNKEEFNKKEKEMKEKLEYNKNNNNQIE